ncbi:DUF975 family protein, partial [Bacteroides sp.]
MKLNSELRQQAAGSLTGNWGMAAVITLVYLLLTGSTSSASQYINPSFGLISILLLPLHYGFAILFLDLLRGVKLDLGRLFDGYKGFGRILGTGLLQAIYTLLWLLLLIVPGIVKSYSYAMTSYILKDHPELQYDAAISKSMVMMSGYKMKLFLLDLSFIGWGILCLFTLGIGFLFLSPYMQAA